MTDYRLLLVCATCFKVSFDPSCTDRRAPCVNRPPGRLRPMSTWRLGFLEEQLSAAPLRLTAAQ